MKALRFYRDESGSFVLEGRLPAKNCSGQLRRVSDETRYRYHDAFNRDYTKILTDRDTSTCYRAFVYLVGSHFMEHTANGFFTYLENYYANGLKTEIETYRQLLTAIGARRSVNYLTQAMADYDPEHPETLEKLPIDYTDKEDVFFLLMCYLHTHRKQVGSLGMEYLRSTPMHVTLRPDRKRVTADLGRQTDALIDLGFEYQGTFKVVEMPGVRLIGLLHPRTNIIAIMYEHPQAGSWTECIAMLGKDNNLVVSNSPATDNLDAPPWSRRLFTHDATITPNALLTWIRKELGSSKALRPALDFKPWFEYEYAREMQWRADRGGVTWEEVERIADRMEEERVEGGERRPSRKPGRIN